MKKILIAEDDKFLASAYRLKLIKAGFEIQIASNGVEIFEILETFIPDIILLDLVMPVMDGFIALTKIKLIPKYQNIPVIVASNLGQKDDIDRAKGLGAADFIVKSDLSLDSLITKINGTIK